MDIEYEPIIGMEVHAELLTESKMFCGCSAKFGGDPNRKTCPVCLGLPGSLPVTNRQAVEFTVRTALALNCEINMKSIFHRKNYFYPDLPKGYQISQYDYPIGINGWVEITVNGKTKKIAIRRVHLEEDAGKLVHAEGNKSEVDYNRSGVPLMEIVTMNPPPPGFDQIQSADEAREYLVRLRAILTFIGVNDGKMEEGSLRCEPNISIRPKGQKEFGVKTEIKNLNSFKAVYNGVEYELKRQEKALREGGKVIHETRRWDDARNVTVAMRTKEFEQEYRYFPEPDLVPLVFEPAWIEEQRSMLPELPMQKKHRYMEELGIPETDAEVLTDSPAVAAYFEECVSEYPDAKVCSNWIMGEFLRLVNATGIDPEQAKVKPSEVGELLKMVDKGTINRNTAKNVFEDMFNSGKSAKQIVEEKGLVQISDESAIADAVRQVIADNPKELERYKAGEERLMGFFVGQVMRVTKGKANPGLVNKLLKEELSKA